MIVKCAKCGTKFRLDEGKIGPKGAKVRCSKCQTTFVVNKPAPAPLPEAIAAKVQTSNLLDLAATPTAPDLSLDLPTDNPVGGPTGTAEFPDLATTAPGLDLPGITSPADISPAPPASPRMPPSQEAPIHKMQTAVYTVSPELREAHKASFDSLVLDLDASPAGPPASPPGSGVGRSSFDPDHDAPPVSAGIDIAALQSSGPPKPPPEMGVGGGPFDAPPAKVDTPSDHDDLADLPMEDADLIEAAPSIPNLPAAPQAGGGDTVGLGVPDRPSEAGASKGAESSGGEELIEPFAGPDLNDDVGSMSADGTFVPPSGVGDSNKEGPDFPKSPSGRVELARIKPVRRASGEVAAQRAVSVAQPPASGSSIGVNIAMSIAIVVAIGFGVLLYLGGGRLDLSIIGLGKKPANAPASSSSRGYQDVFPSSLRSVIYPTARGNDVLVLVGTAENRSGEVRKQIDVVAELRDSIGRVVASQKAPLGLPLGPAELHGLTDGDSVIEAFRILAKAHGEPTVAAGATAPFTVVLLKPPSGLSALSHTVHLKAGGAVLPELEPESVVEPDPEQEPRKGKRKGKRKGRRRGRKGKRKAKAALDEE